MLDAVATIMLAGMMFIPIINLVVGTIAGTCLFGVAGGFAGAALAVLITIAALNRGVGKPAAPRQLAATMEHLFLHWGPERRRATTPKRRPWKSMDLDAPSRITADRSTCSTSTNMIVPHEGDR